jgi:hypothetical protein
MLFRDKNRITIFNRTKTRTRISNYPNFSGNPNAQPYEGPRDQVVVEEDAVARCKAPGVWTARPVRVGVRSEGVDWLRAEVETGGQSTFHVA